MDKNKYTDLTSGSMKLLIAHDGNYNDFVIDRVVEIEIYNEDGNVVKTFPIPDGVSITIDEEITEKNRKFYEAMRDIN